MLIMIHDLTLYVLTAVTCMHQSSQKTCKARLEGHGKPAGGLVIPSVGKAISLIFDMVRRGLVYVKDGAWYVVGW